MLETIRPSMPVLIENLGYLYPKEDSKQPRLYGIYKCSCGKEFKVQSYNINSSKTVSCGCYNIKKISERRTTHGLSSHPIYSSWANMINRCTNPSHHSYKDYYGRGITICDRWLNSFQNFYDDMIATWDDGLSIDRINNNNGYFPDNCRWTTRFIQNRNTRKLISTNTSGYRGVCWISSKKKWRAEIGFNKQRKSLGYFTLSIEAAKAYDQYVIDNDLGHTINGVL